MKKLSAFSFVIINLCCGQALASAWPQEENKWFVANNFLYYQTDTFVDKNGIDSKVGEFQKYEFNPYIEYGLSRSSTIGANIFLDYLTQPTGGIIGNPEQNNYGLGDTEIFFRQKIYETGAATFSVQPLLKFNGDTTSSSFPEIGSKGVDMELRWLGGYKFGEHKSNYANAEIAYRTRLDDDLSDQVRVDAKAGFLLAPSLTVEAASFNTFATSFKATSASGSITQSADYDLSKFQLSAIYKYQDDVNFQLGGFTDLHSRNTGDGSGGIVSIWHNF